jgi:recombination protein RecA
MVAKKSTKVAADKKVRQKVVPIRRRIGNDENYFASGTSKNLEFVSSGCELFDQMIGGGYVLGRIANIVGDKSSGKTLQAIEACANFVNAYPEGIVRYAETEAAFDQSYAAALGIPVDKIDFPEGIFTVEDWFEDMEKTLDSLNGRPALYIVDSLDALSDRAELERDIDKGSYNMSKPKLIGELFRRLVKKIESSRMLIIVVSQIRDKIGVTFGETKTRSGGRALDFYASQIVWLSEIGKRKKTISGIERIIGLDVQAYCKKNKVGLPFRKVQYPLLFGYGVDDLTANAEFLFNAKALSKYPELGLSNAGYKIRINNLREKGGDEVKELRKLLVAAVRKEWQRVETEFLPSSKKY